MYTKTDLRQTMGVYFRNTRNTSLMSGSPNNNKTNCVTMKTKEQHSYHIDTYISLSENLVLIKDRESRTYQHIPPLSPETSQSTKAENCKKT